jgi:hypothetical protein
MLTEATLAPPTDARVAGRNSAFVIVLQIYIVGHIALRSVTDGIDRLYDTKFSEMLSAIAILVALTSSVFIGKTPAKGSRIYRTILYLAIFIGISGVSWLYNTTVTGSIRDEHEALVVSTRFIYYLSMLVLCSYVYKVAGFVRKIHIAYGVLLTITSVIALVQYFSGSTSSASDYEDFERVWGFSAHPVLLSVELVLMLLVYELSRRKLQMETGIIDLLIYALTLAALVVAVSKTGVVVLGMVCGIYILLRRPILIPIFLISVIGFIFFTPYGEHFSELKSIPEFISSGDYTVWDPRTALTSFHWRLTHWYFLFVEAVQQPWLGFGPGQVVSHNSFGLDAHSQFLQVFFDEGLIGLVAYCFFWFSIPFAVLSTQVTSVRGNKKVPIETEARDIWLIMFVALTLASTFSFGFSLATLAYSHFIVAIFVVMANGQPNSVSEEPVAVFHTSVDLAKVAGLTETCQGVRSVGFE